MVSRSCFRLCFFGFPDTLLLMACAPIYIFGDISSWKTICCWKFNIFMEYKVSFCYCLLSWVNVTDKGFVLETSTKKSIRAHGICCHQVFSSLVYNGIQVVSKSSNKIHARMWIVCLFVFLACIQMYRNLWYFMVHILNDFCVNFK